MEDPMGMEIVRRAYELWEQAGMPDGMEQEFYRQAEQELRDADKSSPDDLAESLRPTRLPGIRSIPETSNTGKGASNFRAHLSCCTNPLRSRQPHKNQASQKRGLTKTRSRQKPDLT
jgi:Protein of unknown function (DUF2934)